MAHRPAMRQAPCFDRLRALVVGHLCTVGRHTIMQVLMARGLIDADWSAVYRLFSMPRLDDDVLMRCFLHETLAQIADPGGRPLRRGGERGTTPTGRSADAGRLLAEVPAHTAFKPGIHRAALCAPGDAAATLAGLQPGAAFALGARLPAQGRAASAASRKYWEAALAELCWLRAELDAAGRAAQDVLGLVGGSFGGCPAERSPTALR